MNKQQAHELGTTIGQCIMALGGAMLIFPAFKALAYLATIYNTL